MGTDSGLKERLIEVLEAVKDRFNGRDVTGHVDERGRLTIKEDDRKALGIHGKSATLDLHARVLEVDGEDEGGN